MAEQTQTPESDDPKSEQFRDYIRYRQLEMLSGGFMGRVSLGRAGCRRPRFRK